MDWKKHLNPESWHPAAKLFPVMGERELIELADDIRRNGLLYPITMLGNQALDGRNRLLACAKAGVEPWFVQWAEKKMSPTEWVLSQNLRRRHLSESQAAMVATGAIALLEKEAKERQRLHGGTAPGGPKTLRQTFDGVSDDPHGNLGKATERAAILFNTNRQYVYDAKLIREKDPGLAEAVKRGEITIPEAKKKLGLAPKRWTITLHPELDRDIIDYYPKETRSETVREALRFYARYQQENRAQQPPISLADRPPMTEGPAVKGNGFQVEQTPKTTTPEDAEAEMDKAIEELFK